MQTNPLSWNVRHTLALADVNEQKQHSGKERWERLSADNMTNKSKADANRDFIWIPRGFSPGICPKLFWWVASQGLSFTHWWEVSTSKIIHHSLCFSLPCSHPHLLTSLCLLRLCSALLLSLFPVAGNSHNCRPMFPSIAGGGGVWLGRLWMLSSSGSLSAASKQRMLLPTSKALLHTWQTGGQESQYSYQQACVFEVGR